MLVIALFMQMVQALVFTNQDIPKLYSGNYSILCHHPESNLTFWNDIITNFTKIEIESTQTELLSILEIRNFPSVKVVENGRVYTFDHEFTIQRINRFLERYRKSRYYDYLPVSYSVWSKLQLDFYLYMRDYQEKLAQSLSDSIMYFLESSMNLVRLLPFSNI
jgi:hypothetical protein